jgi:hypothetical protein
VTEDYRGQEIESPLSRFLRRRWAYGSVCVLNIDHLICSYDLTRGLLIEWKHADARDKNWRIVHQPSACAISRTARKGGELLGGRC